MRFEPVFLPEDRKLDGRMSQTFLRHANGCMRSGFLYALFKGEASTVEMQRGKALHAIVERARREAIVNGEAIVPGEIVKDIANDVLTEMPLPVEEHDYVREAVFRWAREETADPASVVALETLFAVDIAGVEVRCKVDFAELLQGGGLVRVKDWKSSRGAPGFEEIARKRPDGSLAAKNFQLVLYAVAMAFGVPVREEIADGERVEIREPFPVAGQAQAFELEFVFPGIEDRERKIVRRPVSLTRLELVEYRASIEALVRRVLAAEESGDWPAVVSDQACSECPAKRLCPIPVELRDHAGRINTPDEAAEALQVLDRRKAHDAAVLKEVKAFVKTLPGEELRYGQDMVLERTVMESERIADKDGLRAAVERARLYGEPFEWSDYAKTVKSTPWKQRRLTEAELAEALAEGSNEKEAA